LRKERDSATRRAITRACNVGFVRRPRYLFSDLSKCGVCGGWVHHGRLAARFRWSARRPTQARRLSPCYPSPGWPRSSGWRSWAL